MPTLAVGMLWDSSANLMPKANVGMAPINSELTEHLSVTFKSGVRRK
jgi:hypothetical protein